MGIFFGLSFMFYGINQGLVDSAPGHQEFSKPPSGGFFVIRNVCYGSLADIFKKII
jgi:hypothetical protein